MSSNLDIRVLPKHLQQIAIKELNEVPERLEDDIKHIKDWIAKQPQLKCRTDDQWILTFLRGCKFNMQKTKSKIEYYYAFRQDTPELFNDLDPFSKEVQDGMKLNVFFNGINSSLGCVNVYAKFGKVDPEKMPPALYVKLQLMCFDLLLHENNNAVGGLCAFLDLKDINYKWLLLLTPSICKKIITAFMVAYPLRVKFAHIFNAPSVFQTIYDNLMKPILPEKYTKKIIVHTGYSEEVFKDIPLAEIPKDFGGEGPTIDELSAELKKNFEKNRDFFLKLSEYHYDKSKRPKDSYTFEEYGADGSFRKLNID